MISIAIDGPAGAGKSSLARAAAGRLGFIYVDTGALYRTLGLKFLRTGASPEDGAAVEALLAHTSVELKFVGGEQRVFLDGTDVSEQIRTPEVSKMASRVSALPAVRAFLLEMQRSFAETDNVLMDGRDIGTVVLPRADVKIFLTASPEERARRRWRELAAKGDPVSYEQVYEDMVRRDYEDSHRAAAPLRPAQDAVTVDTSGLDLEESLAVLLDTIRKGLERT